METTGSKLTDLTDYELVQLAIEQNQAAFIVLYTRYNIGVRSHISRYVAQKEEPPRQGEMQYADYINQ